jgi:hypothetical protein
MEQNEVAQNRDEADILRGGVSLSHRKSLVYVHRVDIIKGKTCIRRTPGRWRSSGGPASAGAPRHVRAQSERVEARGRKAD